MSQSQKMRNALSKYVIPDLIAEGFTGEYPHYKRVYDDRIELLTFETNKWGNSFTVEVSAVFPPERGRDSNLICSDFTPIENATVWDTKLRYRLKGMYDGWFYYTDLYRQKIKSVTIYNPISESKAETYIPSKNEVLVQKADAEIYQKLCEEVNLQMISAYKWLDAFHKNNKLKMKLLEMLK